MAKIKIMDTASIFLAIFILIIAITFLIYSFNDREINRIKEDRLKWNGDGFWGGISTKEGQKIVLIANIKNETGDIYLHEGTPEQHASEIEEKDIIYKKVNTTQAVFSYTVKNEKIISFYIDTYGYKEIEVDYILKEKYNVFFLFFSTTFFVIASIFLYGIIKNIEVKKKITIELRDSNIYDKLIKYISNNNFQIESKEPKAGKISARRLTFLNTTGEKYDFVIERLGKNSSRLLISSRTIHNVSHNSRYLINIKIEELINFIKNSGKSRKFKKR